MEQVETGNGTPARLSENTGPSKSAVQKRIDKLTRERHELRADLERALALIERFKLALRAARSNHA
jgi:hypothetical protein